MTKNNDNDNIDAHVSFIKYPKALTVEDMIHKMKLLNKPHDIELPFVIKKSDNLVGASIEKVSKDDERYNEEFLTFKKFRERTDGNLYELPLFVCLNNDPLQVFSVYDVVVVPSGEGEKHKVIFEVLENRFL